MNLPINKFYIVSEGEDLLTADDEQDFEQADDLLNAVRESTPDKVWSLIAEINA